MRNINGGTIMTLDAASKILRTVPREKAFYFFTSIGNYTGVSASSLKEFMERIGEVNVKSLEFHLYRGDFEKWMAEVLQDTELAGDIRRLQKLSLTGNGLRDQLSFTVSRRLKRLTGQSSSSRF
jgi:alpha-amylase